MIEASGRALLVDLRASAAADGEELIARIEAISAARVDANTDDEHDPEGATIAFERAQAEALLRAAAARVADAEAALTRWDTGMYGLCAVCGTPIAAGRLAARPTAAACVRHA